MASDDETGKTGNIEGGGREGEECPFTAVDARF
jgi:hypothetical protein